MNQLRLVFGFFTILPVSRAGGIHEIAESGYLLPLVAVVLGGAEGLAGWGSLQLFGPAVTGALVLGLALLLTGFHHADGLADIADAVMAGGSKSRRLQVLKDKTMGIGAVVALILTYIVSWAALVEAIPAIRQPDLPWLLMTVEVSARLSLITLAYLSKASHEGSGSAFVAGLKKLKGMLAIAFSTVLLAALAVPLGYTVPLACWVAALATGLLFTKAGGRWFGGANGDLLGASVELGKMAALLAAAAAVS